MKEIIGFVPTFTKFFSFGIPVYVDDDCNSNIYFHILDEKSKEIVNFQKIEGAPVGMFALPVQFRKLVDIGSPAIFAITAKHEIFVGNRNDIQPYYDVIISKAGKNFIEEFKTIF